MSKNRGAPVVITRKQKRWNKTGHLLAFALTGGMSAPITAARAAQVAHYNGVTKKLVAESEQAGRFSESDHERARRAGQQAMEKLARNGS